MNAKLKNGVFVFKGLMSFIYLIFGIVLLFLKSNTIPISESMRLFFGVILSLYGLFRIVNFVLELKIKQKDITIMLSVTLLFFISCQSPTDQASKHDDILPKQVIAIDETLRPLMEAEMDVFNALEKDSLFTIIYAPDKIIRQMLLQDSAVLVVSPTHLNDEEIKFLNSKTYYPRQTKIAIDAIAVITNSSTKDSLMTIDNLKNLLITKVNTNGGKNNGLNDQSLNIVFDNKNSSIVQYMMDSVCNGMTLNTNTFALDYNNQVVEYTATHPGTIGFVGASWITDHNDSLHLSFHKKIRIIAISNSTNATVSNSYLPYQAYMMDQQYPFTRGIYVINNEPKNGSATRLAAFLASERGQRIILKCGILPAIAPTRLVSVRPNL